jgi:hypothetical protein
MSDSTQSIRPFSALMIAFCHTLDTQNMLNEN